MPKPPGVLCLEGDWEDSPASKMSVESALSLLEHHEYLRVRHRNVNTMAELDYHLSRWTMRPYNDFPFLYLGFHGHEEAIYLGDEPVGLQQLKLKLADKCHGKVLFLASCSALDTAPDDLKKFCRDTKAEAIVGYTRDVDYIEAAAFEIMLFSELSKGASIPATHTAVARRYPDLSRHLGFTSATSRSVKAEN